MRFETPPTTDGSQENLPTPEQIGRAPVAELAAAESRTLLGRIAESARERAKPLVFGLSLLTLTAGELGWSRPSGAEERRETPPVSERERRIEEELKKEIETREGIASWKKLRAIADFPEAISPQHNESIKMEVGRVIIYELAMRLKTLGKTQAEVEAMKITDRFGRRGIWVSPADTRRALEVLNISAAALCAEENPTKSCTPDELTDFNRGLLQTAGGKAFLEMFR